MHSSAFLVLLALNGFQETVLLIFRMSAVTLHLCALKILQSEQKKAPSLFCTPDIGSYLLSQNENGTYRSLSVQYLLTSEVKCIASQVSDLCNGNIYCSSIQFSEPCGISLCYYKKEKKLHSYFQIQFLPTSTSTRILKIQNSKTKSSFPHLVYFQYF